MLVITAVRHLLPKLDQYLDYKISKITGQSFSIDNTSLKVLISYFTVEDKKNNAYINAYNEEGQLSWEKLMNFSREELSPILKNQLKNSISLSFLKAMLIYRFRHKLAALLVVAEEALKNKESIAISAEQQLMKEVNFYFEETQVLLNEILLLTDFTVQPIDRVKLEIGSGPGESEEKIMALNYIFSEACTFIIGQDCFNMSPSIYNAVKNEEHGVHPVMMLRVQALDYIMTCADQEADYTISGSQRSWMGAAWSAVSHPLAATQKIVGKFFYDPQLAHEKRQVVSKIVTDLNRQVPYKVGKTLKEKHWREALSQVDAGYDDLYRLGYHVTVHPQQSLIFLKEAHSSLMHVAPKEVQAEHKQRCKLMG